MRAFKYSGYPARGCPKGNHIKVVVAFDPLTFDELRQRALSDGTSMAQAVRSAVEAGLEAMTE